METLTYNQFSLRSQNERGKETKGLVYSFLLHTAALACLVYVLNIQKPPEPAVQIFSVALIQEQSAAAPVKKAPKPVKKIKKKKKVVPPPPPKEDAISLNKPKKVEKKKAKPFEFKKKNVASKKRPKKKTPPPPPKVVKKKPTLEEELRELERERQERMKKRTLPIKEKRVKYASSSIKVDALEFPFPWYINAVKLQADKNWSPMAELGTVIKKTIVVFVIGRDGQVMENSVEKSSGIPEFDLSAMRAIANSSFPPLPVGFNDPSLKIHIGFTHDPE